MPALLGYSPYSYAAVPAFWVLAVLPHFAALGVKMSANVFDNTNPRHDEKIVEKAGAEKVTLIQKLDAASANGMENLPLFAAAVILSALAKVPEEQTAASAKMVLLFRAIYPIAYVAGKNQALSFLRTGAYLGSIFYILQMFSRCVSK